MRSRYRVSTKVSVGYKRGPRHNPMSPPGSSMRPFSGIGTRAEVPGRSGGGPATVTVRIDRADTVDQPVREGERRGGGTDRCGAGERTRGGAGGPVPPRGVPR